MSHNIAAIIEAAFNHVVEFNTDGRGITDLDELDSFIEAVKEGLSRVEKKRADFIPVSDTRGYFFASLRMRDDAAKADSADSQKGVADQPEQSK
jgi:hypothetical protein